MAPRSTVRAVLFDAGPTPLEMALARFTEHLGSTSRPKDDG
jgi:hypothetical protein